MDLNEIVIPLGLFILLVANLIGYHLRWHGADAALETALEAAAAGDTETALRRLDRLMKGWRTKPQQWFSPMYVASRMVVAACCGGNPETAQAVLDHLGLTRGELMWEEEGSPAVPLLEHVKRDPDYAEIVAFLEGKSQA